MTEPAAQAKGDVVRGVAAGAGPPAERCPSRAETTMPRWDEPGGFVPARPEFSAPAMCLTCGWREDADAMVNAPIIRCSAVTVEAGSEPFSPVAGGPLVAADQAPRQVTPAFPSLSKGAPVILAWKFIRPDLRLCNDDPRSWKPGETVTHEGKVVLCERGLHASVEPRHALGYASSDRTWLARVECSGEIAKGEDKIACSSMRVLWIADPTATLRRLALRWADHAVRVVAVDALRKVGLTAEADRLAACAEIIDEKTAWAARYAAGAARYAAWAASDAAINADLEAAFQALSPGGNR